MIDQPQPIKLIVQALPLLQALVKQELDLTFGDSNRL